jgi:hypothetical protein
MAKATVITVQLSPWPTHPFAGPGSTLLSSSSLVAGSSLNSTQQHWDSIEEDVVFVITYAVPGRNNTHHKQTVFYFMLLLGLGLAHGGSKQLRHGGEYANQRKLHDGDGIKAHCRNNRQ